MKKWLKFRFTGFIYKVDLIYDKLVNTLLYKKISKYNSGLYYDTINFEDGSEFQFWCCNKWYAWMSKGYYTTPEGEKITFDHVRPKRKTMRKFYFSLHKNIEFK